MLQFTWGGSPCRWTWPASWTFHVLEIDLSKRITRQKDVFDIDNYQLTQRIWQWAPRAWCLQPPGYPPCSRRPWGCWSRRTSWSRTACSGRPSSYQHLATEILWKCNVKREGWPILLTCGVGVDRPLDQLDMARHVEARSPAGVPAILKDCIYINKTYIS